MNTIIKKLKNMQYGSDIIDYLNHIKSEIELYNGLKLYNINKFAEYFYSEFLNLLFGYELEIMEKVNPNMVAIDLDDKNGKIAIQITSQVEREKIKETIEKFNENGLDKVYERLVVLHIANKTPNYNKPHTIEQFNLKEDVWNIEYLLSKMPIENIDKLKDIRDFLKKYVGDSPRISNLDTLLKQRYTSENFTKLKPLSSPNQDIHLQDIYQDLSIIKKKKSDKEKGKEVNIDELLNESKKVSILGKSGIGKSTLTKYICYQWANGKLFNNYDYLFYIPIKKWEKGEGIFDVVVKVLKESINENIKIKPNDLYGYIKSFKDKTLFVIDGFDEIKDEYREEIKKEIQNFDSYIITSRHNGLKRNELNIEETFENEGFNQESIENFIRHTSNSDELIKRINNNSRLEELSKIPMLLDIICYLYKENQIDFTTHFTMTSLYEKFLDKIILRFKKKRKSQDNKIERKDILKLGKIAFENLKNNDFRFEGSFATRKNNKFDLKKLEPLGFLSETIQDGIYEFIHTSFQEYFSALYVSKLSPKKQKKIIQKWKFYPHMQVFFAFLGGLIEDKEFLIKEIQNKPKDILGIYELVVLIQIFSQIKKEEKNKDLIEDFFTNYQKYLKSSLEENVQYSLLINNLSFVAHIITDNFMDTIIEIIKDESIYNGIRIETINVLAKIGIDDKYVDTLIEIVKNEKVDYALKEAVATAFVGIERDDDTFINTLMEIIKDKNISYGYIHNIKEDIFKALVKIERDDDKYADTFIEIIKDEYIANYIRIDAINALVKIKRDDKYIDIIIEMIKDEKIDSLVRREIATALVEIERDDNKYIDTLIEIIKDEKIHCLARGNIAEVLTKIKSDDINIVNTLVEIIKDKKINEFVKRDIANALSKIKRDDNIIIDTLIDIIKDEKIDENVRGEVADALVKIERDDNIILDTFIKIIKNEKINEYSRWSVARALSEIEIDDNMIIVDTLIKFIKDNKINEKIRGDIASMALTKIKRDDDIIVDTLIEFIKDKKIDDDDKDMIMRFLLKKVGKDDDKYADTFIEIIKDENINICIKKGISYTLAKIQKDDDKYINTLIEIIKDENIEIPIKTGVSYALANIKRDDNIIVNTLIEIIKDKKIDEIVKRGVADALVTIERNYDDIIGTLIEIIKDKNINEITKESIANVLARIEKYDDKYINTFIDIIQDTKINMVIRDAIVSALITIESNDDMVVNTLIKFIKEKEFKDIYLTLRKLAKFPNPDIFLEDKEIPKDTKEIFSILCPTENLFKAYKTEYENMVKYIIYHLRYKKLPLYINKNKKLYTIIEEKKIYTEKINKNSLNKIPEIKEALNLLKKNKNTKSKNKSLIITEGKTDWKHLKKALEKFQKRGEYLDLNIEFKEFENISMSDSELDNYVQTHAKQINSQKIICIFDRDLPERVKEYGQYDFVHVANKQLVNTIKDKCKKAYGKSSKKYLNIVNKLDSFQYDMIDSELREILAGKEYREWEIQLKNNVYAFCIPKLSDKLDEICIEFYYKEKDLKTEDANGKRLFIADEFKFNKENSNNCNRFISKCGKYKTDTQSGKNHNRHVTLQYPNKNNYGYVYKIEEEECNKSNHVNLSKNDFAKNIYNDVEGFDNFDIENFRLIFDVIERIIND